MCHVNSFKIWQKGQQSATKRMGGPENNKKTLNSDGDYDNEKKMFATSMPGGKMEVGVEPWSLSRNGMPVD
jgi:hypothetical protein